MLIKIRNTVVLGVTIGTINVLFEIFVLHMH